MPQTIPFDKKELLIQVHNSNNLPTIDFHELKELQGDLKITTPAKIQKLKNSIKKYGVFVPKFTWIDNGTHYIEDGHQTIKALTELEKEGYAVPEIPYAEVQAKDRKDAGEKLLMINSKFADINPETSFFTDFGIELDFMDEIEIPELELDFDGLGKEVIEDEVPEPPEEPVTCLGDLWLCGKHRVLCGDCTKVEDVERVMQGKKCDCVLTDPPYGIDQKGIPHDTPKEAQELIKNTIALLPVSNAVIVAFQSTRTFPIWLDAIRTAGYTFERILSLYKEAQCTFPWRGWILKTESILVSSIGNPKWQEVKPYVHDVYKLSEVSGELDPELGWHGAIKPLVVVKDILSRICPENGNVYDSFLGSGTTLIAADQLNRICYGIEIEPRYIDVILERYYKLTGNDPIGEDGKKWSEVKSI